MGMMPRSRYLIHNPVVATAGFQRDMGFRRQHLQVFPKYLPFMSHPNGLSVFAILVDGSEYRKCLVRITSDRMFDHPLQLLSSWGFLPAYGRNPAAALS